MLCIAALGITLAGCGGAKLSTANEQMARGEYFDASKTYRKIYNKLTKREERPQRGEVAFRLGQCSEKLNQYARAAAAYQNAARYGYADSTFIDTHTSPFFIPVISLLRVPADFSLVDVKNICSCGSLRYMGA